MIKRAFLIFLIAAMIILNILPSVLHAGPLDNLHWRGPLPRDNDFFAVTYGNGIFVAVGLSGTILTSPDGDTWTARETETINELTGVAYGGGIFIAVGVRTIVTSSDGINWTSRPVTNIKTSYLSDITYGNGKFVAVKFDGEILTSSDGTEWSISKPGISSLMKVTFGNGIFIIVGRNNVLTSSDAIHWTVQNVTFSYSDAIAYGNGLFVIVDGTRAFTSADGVNWTESNWDDIQINVGDFFDVTYGNGIFVAVGPDVIATSTNGRIWTVSSSGAGSALYGVAAGSGKFVAVGVQGKIATSSDGVNWNFTTISDEFSKIYINSVTYGNGLFIAAGGSYGIKDGFILSSDDGANWVLNDTGFQYTFQDVVYGNGIFVAVGNQGTLATSPDGMTWTVRDSGTPEHLSGITYGNGKFVAVSKKVTVTSTDGINWAPVPLETTILPEGTEWYSFNSVTYGNNMFVAAGSFYSTHYVCPFFTCPDFTFPAILTSPDGISWKLGYFADNQGYFNGITFGKGKFVAVGCGQGGFAASSYDGVTWVTTALSDVQNTCNGGYGITTANGIFVASGLQGLFTSLDGLHWTEKDLSNAGFISDIAYGENTFVVVGRKVILQSNALSQNCAATLSSNDLMLHIPIVTFGGVSYWADMKNVRDTMDIALTDFGIVENTDPFNSCFPSTLSPEFNLSIPSVMFNGDSYWADFLYSHDMTVTLTAAGRN